MKFYLLLYLFTMSLLVKLDAQVNDSALYKIKLAMLSNHYTNNPLYFKDVYNFVVQDNIDCDTIISKGFSGVKFYKISFKATQVELNAMNIYFTVSNIKFGADTFIVANDSIYNNIYLLKGFDNSLDLFRFYNNYRDSRKIDKHEFYKNVIKGNYNIDGITLTPMLMKDIKNGYLKSNLLVNHNSYAFLYRRFTKKIPRIYLEHLRP